ncbi:unnamed protein product [marine sediment metagenome]|uniref:Uncharacterized protein n=1 Tax=marine sediment metagenome TaxID=412755 RepID=X1MGL4_9ZZZZ
MVYPVSKLPFEELTTIDERVDYVHNQLVAAQLALNQLLEKEGMPPMTVVTRDVNLRVLLQPNTGTRVSRPSPLTGRMVQLIPHWPDGCNALVDVAVGHKDTWIYPHLVDTFVALNDATPVLTVDEPITKGEEIWMIVRNADGREQHAITVTATIIGVE